MNPERIITIKGHNRRVTIVHFFGDNESQFLVETKRLSDKKTREIIVSKTHFTYATIRVVIDALNSMFYDNEFRRQTQHEFDELLKHNFKSQTNIKSLL